MNPRALFSLLLSIQVAWFPCSGWAQGNEGLPSLAVVELAVPVEMGPEAVTLRAAFFKAFSDSGRARLVPRKEIESWRERAMGPSKYDSAKKSLAEARELLVRGRKAYNSLNFRQALSYLEEARRLFILNLQALRNNRELIESHLFLGTAYLALQEKTKAREEFRRVVYLDPKRELSSRDFPPKVMAEFASVRQEVSAQDPVRVRVTSDPSKATVYLNGRQSGETPVELTLYPGEYFLLLEKERMNPWFAPIQIKRRIQNFDVTLKPSTVDTSWRNLFRIREGEAQASEDITALADFAKTVGAQIVFLGELRKDPGFRLFGQLWDQRTGDFSNVAVEDLGEDVKEGSLAAKDVASSLLSFIRADGYVIPAAIAGQGSMQDLTVGGADRPKDEAAISPAPKKPWYKTWWIWPLVGGAAAGLAIGITQFAGSDHSGEVVIDNRGNF